MKLHNSTEVTSTSHNERKFIIRYHESHSFSTSKKIKSRYSDINNTFGVRSSLLSEADAYREEQSVERKEVAQVK